MWACHWSPLSGSHLPPPSHTHAGPAGRQPLASPGSAALHGPLPPGLEPFLFVPVREREQHVGRSPSLPAATLSGGFPLLGDGDATPLSTQNTRRALGQKVSGSRFASPTERGVRSTAVLRHSAEMQPSREVRPDSAIGR